MKAGELYRGQASIYQVLRITGSDILLRSIIANYELGMSLNDFNTYLVRLSPKEEAKYLEYIDIRNLADL